MRITPIKLNIYNTNLYKQSFKSYCEDDDDDYYYEDIFNTNTAFLDKMVEKYKYTSNYELYIFFETMEYFKNNSYLVELHTSKIKSRIKSFKDEQKKKEENLAKLNDTITKQNVNIKKETENNSNLQTQVFDCEVKKELDIINLHYLLH